MSDPAGWLLTMQGIRKRFGATRALDGMDLRVRGGEVLAVIGENGAGKSTLMKVLSGAHAPDGGTMELAGRPFAPAGPHAARLAGVAMIYQELNLAPDLSVEDNVMLGQERQRYGWLDRGAQRRRLSEVMTMLGHAELDCSRAAGRLSVAQQQVVEIARALVCDAKVIVFDEPTSTLSAGDVERLFAVIRKLKASGLAVIYISHFLEEVRAVADRYLVLRDGRSAGQGRLEGTSEAEIVAMMVGRAVKEMFPLVPHQQGEQILEVNGLRGRGLPRAVSFVLHRGEILGIAGLVGAGRTELLRCLFGLDAVRGGRVRLAGYEPGRSPRDRIRRGMGMVCEDRKREGLAQSMSIADNMTLSRMSGYARWGWLGLSRRRQAVAGWMERLGMKAASPTQPVAELSGGNQQKVALARVLHQEADVLLLDEPTRGIDVATKAEIYRMIGQAAAAGKAVLFVSSYLPELLAVCDRVAVMARGRLREIRRADQWSEEAVMACAMAGEEAVVA